MFANIIKDVSHHRPRKISMNEVTSFSPIEKEKQISSKLDHLAQTQETPVTSENSPTNQTQSRKESIISNVTSGNESRKASHFYTKNKFDLVDPTISFSNMIIPGKRNKSYSINNAYGFNCGKRNSSQNKENKDQVPLNKDYYIGGGDSSKKIYLNIFFS
jgi:hypothetical protein